MDEFRLTIQLDNEAFEDDPSTEVVRILRTLANSIEKRSFFDAGNDYPLFDCNGNDVGYAGWRTL